MKEIKSFNLAPLTNHALASFCAESQLRVTESIPSEHAALCAEFAVGLNDFRVEIAALLCYKGGWRVVGFFG